LKGDLPDHQGGKSFLPSPHRVSSINQQLGPLAEHPLTFQEAVRNRASLASRYFRPYSSTQAQRFPESLPIFSDYPSDLQEVGSVKKRIKRDRASHLPAGALVGVMSNGNFMLDRYRGSLLGLAVGDALGTTAEFKAPGTFSPVTDIIGRGPFDLKPGEWTDDTSMALCLAESLIQCRGFDAKDQMDHYCRWHEQGYLSSNGRCFDIGDTVVSALARYQDTAKLVIRSRVPNHRTLPATAH